MSPRLPSSATRAKAHKFPPGPPPLPFVGEIFRYRRDRLGFLAECRRRFGPSVTVHFGRVPVFLFFTPETVVEILSLRSSLFLSRDAVQNVRFLLGDTLSPSNLFESTLKVCCGCMHESAMLASDGPEHWKQRRAAHPGPSLEETGRFVRIMAVETERIAATWASGGCVDMVESMQTLSLRIVARTLFDLDIDRDGLHKAFRYLVGFTLNPLSLVRQLPLNFAFLPYGRYVRAWQKIESAVEEMLARHTSGSRAVGLRNLLDTATEATPVLPRARVRHYVFQMLGMGHTTTSSALTFALGLLAQYPTEAEKLRREIEECVGDGSLSIAALANLPRLEMAILETLRLYPVIWGQARRAAEDVAVEDYELPRGSFVIVSSWVMHRLPESFPEPDVFQPSRFAEDVRKGVRTRGYFPFGIGPHTCLGERFALLEMKVVLATLLRRFSFRAEPGFELAARARSVILQPQAGLRIDVSPLRVPAMRTQPAIIGGSP